MSTSLKNHRHHVNARAFHERKEKEIDEQLAIVEQQKKDEAKLASKVGFLYRMSKGKLYSRARKLKREAFQKERALLESTSLGDLIK